MSIERVRTYLSKYNIANNILEFPVSSATVELAAIALNTEPNRIAKSLSFMLDHPIIIVTSGDMKIDNVKYKQLFDTKAKMLSPEDAELIIGHAVGGVCPFGVNDNVKVYLDESLKDYEIVNILLTKLILFVIFSLCELAKIHNLENGDFYLWKTVKK